jgi:cleavage and polyadenylation specificity factor subunit 1
MTEDTNDGKQSRDDEVRATANFVAVGTGIVDQDGEDVVSKGKVLLFHVNSSTDDKDPPPSLSLAYQKDILLGPVNSLSTLIAEGTFRLVIGAGAEVAIEQWGAGKLTQVGFFHAHMYVLDIKIFKNFFLLSDA